MCLRPIWASCRTSLARTLVDIVYLPYLDYLMATPQKAAVAERGNVMAWWSRCSQRPSWRKAAGR